jgi:hypothetical protein
MPTGSDSPGVVKVKVLGAERIRLVMMEERPPEACTLLSATEGKGCLVLRLTAREMSGRT